MPSSVFENPTCIEICVTDSSRRVFKLFEMRSDVMHEWYYCIFHSLSLKPVEISMRASSPEIVEHS